MRTRALLTASALLTLMLVSGVAHALPPGYNRNLARQQLANAALTAHARGLVVLKASQSMGLRLATQDRFVDDHVTELQREGVVLGTAQVGSDGGRVLDAILAAQTAASSGRKGVSTELSGTTARPDASTPATKDSAKQTVAVAQTTLAGVRGAPATSLTSVSERVGTPGRNHSMISDVDNPGIWDWLTKSDADMQAEWDKKYGPKPACGDGGDPMCGYKFTGGGASRPNPEATPKRPLPTDLSKNDLVNPRNGSHVTNPTPDGTTGGTEGTDRTAPMPTLAGGGVGNPGSPDNVKAPIIITEKPVISNTNVINPDRSNGAPPEPGQPGTGSSGSVGTPDSKKAE